MRKMFALKILLFTSEHSAAMLRDEEPTPPVLYIRIIPNFTVSLTTSLKCHQSELLATLLLLPRSGRAMQNKSSFFNKLILDGVGRGAIPFCSL
jgi:hypothetical protein